MVEEGTYSYLPDECWEIVFIFLIINDTHCLNSLSLVSKQFLSVTNSLLFSLTVVENPSCPFLGRLLRRFTNLNSLHISANGYDVNKLLGKISRFPLKKLTFLRIFNLHIFPANGLRAFSQNITTLTSLTFSDCFLGNNDLSLIADYFPLLKQLKFDHPMVINETNFINEINCLLSKCPCLQYLDLHRTYFLTDQLVDQFSLFLGNLVSISLSDCWRLTELALFSLIRSCPSLSDIKMENIGFNDVGNSVSNLVEFGVYPQLKSLYLGHNSSLSDEHIITFASLFPNLELLDLHSCYLISEGICQVLRRCCKLRYLNLTYCSRVNLLGMNFVVPKLEVLNLSYTKVDDETLYVISKSCCGLQQLLLNRCKYFTVDGVNHVLENCTQLREITLRDSVISVTGHRRKMHG